MARVYGVTGHRPKSFVNYTNDTYQNLIGFAVSVLTEEEPDKVITGMALGWDMAIASACRRMQIKYVAAVPFAGQEMKWPQASKIEYQSLIQWANDVVVTSPGGYSNEKYGIRNEYIVDNCSVLLSLWNDSEGGTANCNKYAKLQKRRTIQLWEHWEKYLAEQTKLEAERLGHVSDWTRGTGWELTSGSATFTVSEDIHNEVYRAFGFDYNAGHPVRLPDPDQISPPAYDDSYDPPPF